MVSSVRPAAQDLAPPRSAPWLTSLRRRATPSIWQLTGGACDIRLTRPFPLDCYLPDLVCPTVCIAPTGSRIDRQWQTHSIPLTDHPAHSCPYKLLFIRSIDESMSHDVCYSSTIGGFNAKCGYDCS